MSDRLEYFRKPTLPNMPRRNRYDNDDVFPSLSSQLGIMPQHFVQTLGPFQPVCQIQPVAITPFGPLPIGISPLPTPVHPVHTPRRHQPYDYVMFIVVTHDKHHRFEALCPTNRHNKISLLERKVYPSDNPDDILNTCANMYGIDLANVCRIGKYTQATHVEHTSGLKYKLGILYINRLSCTSMDSIFRAHTGYDLHLRRVDLDNPVGFTYTMLERNIITFLSNMHSELTRRP